MTDEANVEKVFVYGTLKQGGTFNESLRQPESEFLGNALTVSKYHFFDLGKFPCICKTTAATRAKYQQVHVRGELYKTRAIKVMDYIEGHPTFYKREQIWVETVNGVLHKAWAYFLGIDNCIGARELLDGEWKNV